MQTVRQNVFTFSKQRTMKKQSMGTTHLAKQKND